MKKSIFMLSALFFVCAMSMAQNKNDLKGPKAKNYKVWQADTESIPVYTIANQRSLAAPKSKNQMPWKAKKGDKVALTRNIRKSQLKGPAAKNYKPWK